MSDFILYYTQVGDTMNRAKARIKIFKAMVKLLETETFESITIKQLCAESGVHRSTFYAHFEDKYQLFDTMTAFHMSKYKKLMNYLSQTVQNCELDEVKYKVLKTFQLMFRYIKRYQAFFTAVIVTHPQVHLIQAYIKLTKDAYKKMLNDLPNLNDADHFIQYTIGGQLSLIYAWLADDCEEPTRRMARILYTNILKTDR